MFCDTVSTCTQRTQRVRFIDHDEGLVLAGDFNEIGQRRHIPIHGIDAFDADEHFLELAARARQQLVEPFDVVMVEGLPHCARQKSALKHRVMNQTIMQDEIPFAEQRTDRGNIRRMARNECDHGRRAVNLGNKLLEFPMWRPLSGNETAC